VAEGREDSLPFVPFAPPVPREWVSFPDPDDPDHEIRADLSFLLSSWACIFGGGCQGIAGQPEQGCCSHGAFFSDAADERRVRNAAKELTTDDWARYGQRVLAQTDELEGQPARRTATVGGACVYLNGPDSAMGAGCALHGLALRTGRHPLELKPDVCWQVPISRAQERREDGSLLTTITEFSRRSWGEGGADLSWWCTESRAAYAAPQPLYASYAAELTALVGAAAYAELAHLCQQRETGARPTLPLV